MVEVYTENRNRTVADLRHSFTKCGGNLSENGSVGWQFKHVGQIVVPNNGVSEDDFTLAALDAGAEDVSNDGENYIVETQIEQLHATNEQLRAQGFEASEVQLTRIATNFASPGTDDMHKLVKLLDLLEDLDDVKETFVNVEIPDEFYEE